VFLVEWGPTRLLDLYYSISSAETIPTSTDDIVVHSESLDRFTNDRNLETSLSFKLTERSSEYSVDVESETSDTTPVKFEDSFAIDTEGKLGKQTFAKPIIPKLTLPQKGNAFQKLTRSSRRLSSNTERDTRQSYNGIITMIISL
jgi:hypothetical protein